MSAAAGALRVNAEHDAPYVVKMRSYCTNRDPAVERSECRKGVRRKI
jgi:hypothetical protein